MVHQYKLNGYNIVLDTVSGSVHAVDEVAYDIIEMYKTHTEDEIVDAILAKYKDFLGEIDLQKAKNRPIERRKYFA